MNTCFPSSFVKFCSVVAEKSKIFKPIRVQDGHLFSNQPKQVLAKQRQGQLCSNWHEKTNFIEDVEYLLPFKFHKFCSEDKLKISRPPLFFDQPENVLANQRQGQPSLFFYWHKIKFRRGCWILASHHFSSNSVQWLPSRSRKYLSRSEARKAIFVFKSVININLVGYWLLASYRISYRGQGGLFVFWSIWKAQTCFIEFSLWEIENMESLKRTVENAWFEPSAHIHWELLYTRKISPPFYYRPLIWGRI